MDIVADDLTADWLVNGWDQTLDWDDGNVGKLTRHGMTVAVVESVLDGNLAFGGRIVPPAGSKWSEERFLIYGQAANGRDIAIIWTIRDNKIRPISCRRMRANERKNYQSKC